MWGPAMTADELATLAKVERLLAEDWTSRLTIPDVARRDEALALLRGLLAEPQPDESQAKRAPKPLHELKPHFVMPSIEAPFLAGGLGLAEPQVNPSEAKGRELLRAFDQIDSAMHELDDAEALDAIVGIVNDARAGLLAEGEESRKP